MNIFTYSLCLIKPRLFRPWLCIPGYCIYPYKRPGGDAFFKGGGGGGGGGGRGPIIKDKKNQLSSPVAIGDNGHLQP